MAGGQLLGMLTYASGRDWQQCVAQRSPRLLLDVRSVHAVSHLVRELRAAGQDRDLLDQVWRRLEDAALLDRDDLRDSLNQMRRREGRVLRPLRSAELQVGG
ncbi:MAG: hypothetical protein ACRDPY_47170 [Streptosporangiaceae bacterium]